MENSTPALGIPLLHIVGSTIVLESPTHASQKAHQDVRKGVDIFIYLGK